MHPVEDLLSPPTYCQNNRTMVLTFRLSPSYHGATLFGALLASHPRIASLGTTFPPRSTDLTCSCAKSVSECDFWRTVAHESGAEQFGTEQLLLPLVPRIFRSNNRNSVAVAAAAKLAAWVGPWIWNLLGKSRPFFRAHERFRETATNLLDATTFVSGVESIMHVTVSITASTQPGTRARIIHLTRDPRGFYSSCRDHLGTPREDAASWWIRAHRAIERLASPRMRTSILRMRYEDLCADPHGEMARAFRFLDLEPVDPLRFREREHHMIGNRMLGTFDGNVELDTRWRTRVSIGDQRAILDATQPLASKYGYT